MKYYDADKVSIYGCRSILLPTVELPNKKIPSMLMRGGTVKGLFFLKSDLPYEVSSRNEILLQIMGSDVNQINGLGEGRGTINRVALVGLSQQKDIDIDIDYTVCWVHSEKHIVDTSMRINCGNLLSGVLPFAIERGLIEAFSPETAIKILNENTGTHLRASVKTPQGKISYTDDAYAIDGVQGTGAVVKISYENIVGKKTGRLFPTGNTKDYINDIEISCIDIIVPTIFIKSSSLGKTGYETRAELENDLDLKDKLHSIWQQVSMRIGIDGSSNWYPKICLLAPPKAGGTISSRNFTPINCHDTHSLSTALCLGAATLVKNTIANELAKDSSPLSVDEEHHIIIEHPLGKFHTFIKMAGQDHLNHG